MERIKVEGGVATVRLSKSELIVLANAINETQEAVEEWEFPTRVGAETHEAENLRQELKALLSSMKEHS